VRILQLAKKSAGANRRDHRRSKEKFWNQSGAAVN